MEDQETMPVDGLTGFFAELKAIVLFSGKEWNWLMLSFQHHYDAELNSAINVGGWLYGMNNMRRFSDESDKTVELSSRQLNHMMKSVENDSEAAHVKVFPKLYKIFSALQSKQDEVNASLTKQ